MVDALVDTGATWSFIAPSLINELPPQLQYRSVNIEVIMGDGSQIIVSEAVKCHVTLGNRTAEYEFLILSTATEPLVLGLDFLKLVGTTITCAGLTVSSAQSTIRVRLPILKCAYQNTTNNLIGEEEMPKKSKQFLDGKLPKFQHVKGVSAIATHCSIMKDIRPPTKKKKKTSAKTTAEGGGAKSASKPGTGCGIRKQNVFDRAKKLLAKNANNKKKDSASADKKTESKEAPSANVSTDMFFCHLCNKHMCDTNSFENHIKGRTHFMMRKGVEESYRMKANMIRQEGKIAEKFKSIELDRSKHMSKSNKRQLGYCTMCDLNFHGHISAHRKSDGHLQLKKFLHPKCIECNKKFNTRIDYDTHLLAAGHLIKAAEKNTKVGERMRQTLPILTEEDELKEVFRLVKQNLKEASDTQKHHCNLRRRKWQQGVASSAVTIQGGG